MMFPAASGELLGFIAFSCSSSNLIGQLLVFKKCLSGQIQPINFSFQTDLPLCNVAIGVRPQHILP